MQYFHFQLSISAIEFQRVYSGAAKHVIVQTLEGKRVQIPALRLQPFLLANGIYGKFRLAIDSNNRFVELERIA